MKRIKKAVLGSAFALLTAGMSVSSFCPPVYASIVNSGGTDLSIGSLANVTLGVDNVDITPVRDNLYHMKYNVTFTLPAGASMGDEIGVTVKNLAGLIDGNIDTTITDGNVVNTDIKYNGEVVARIRPILGSSKNYYNESTNGNTTVSAKLQSNIEAGTSLDNYTIEILKDLPNDAKLDVFVERVVPATFVNKDIPVQGHIYVNGNDSFTVDYTLNKAKVRSPLNINKVNVDMTGMTAKLITKYKDGARVNDHLSDIDFSLKLSPQGMSLMPGTYITLTLPKDCGLVFSPNSLGKSGFIKHYPLIGNDSAVNDNGVYALKFNNVKFDVVDINDTTLTLKLVDGNLVNNDNYEITSDTTDGLGLTLTSDATNLLSDDGTTLGPVDITSKVVDSRGMPIDTITNKLSVKLINGEFTRDNILDYVNNKYKTYYVDETGISLKDEVRADHFADVENIAGYSLVKYSENGNVRRYIYKKLPSIPRGAKLTEYITTDGLTLRDPIVSNKLEDSKDIAGYHIARRDENDNGVKWVYEKDAQTPVMTRFIEYGTHEVLHDTIEGLDPAKPELINGYIHFLTEKLSNGDTVHYYKRQEHNHKREIQTRWVDTEGRAIKDPVNSDEMAVAGYVAGYKFVKTEDVKDNQVKGVYDIVYNHVYEKIPEADLTITTKYITEDGTMLSDALTGKKIADKIDIAGYELVRTSSPSETEFNYIYRKLGDSVSITKPVDNSGHVNTPNGKYTIEYLDENYERLNNSIKMNTLPDKIKTISGYTFVNSKLSGDTIYYIYKPSGKFVARFVDKDGADLSDALVGDTKPSAKDIKGYRLAYTVTFKSGNVNYVYEPMSTTGDTTITKTDVKTGTNEVARGNLPSELRFANLSVSAVAPSTLLSGDRHVTLTSTGKTVFEGIYDNQGNLSKIESVNDNIKSFMEGSTFIITQSGDLYTARIKDKNGNYIAEYSFNASGVKTDSTSTVASNNVTTSKASVDSNSAQVSPVNTVVTKFIDGKGRTILKDRRSSSIVTGIKIDGYTYVETYKDGDIYKAVYKKDNEKVTMYQDEYGTPIKHSDISSGFKTSAKIDGYKLKESVTNDNTKTYIYTHTGNTKPKDLITFKYVDGKGNTILSDTNGVSFANVPTLNGYRFVEAVADGSSIHFVYAGAGDIVTKYKEIDGEDLIHPVISNTDALGKKITGFDIVDRIVSANGDITYTYRRIDGKNATTDKSTWDSSVKASDKNKSETREKSNSSNDSDYDYITRYEDTDGKRIASDEKSNKSYADRKDISGYKYLETRTEDNVKTYVYEKLSEEEAKKQAESQASTTTSTQPSLSNNTNSGSPTTSTQPSLSNNTNNGSTSGSSTINTTPDNKDVKSIKTGLGNIATSKTGMMYLLFSIATLGIVSAITFRDKLGAVVKGFVKRIKK